MWAVTVLWLCQLVKTSRAVTFGPVMVTVFTLEFTFVFSRYVCIIIYYMSAHENRKYPASTKKLVRNKCLHN